MKSRLHIIFLALVWLNMLSVFSQVKYDTAIFKKEYRDIDKVLEVKVDSALGLIKTANQKAKKYRYAYGYAKTNLQFARYYSLKGKVDSAVLFIPTAIKYARAAKDTGLIVSSYLFNARSLATLGEYNKAVEQALVAQKYGENLKDFKLRSRVFHDLAFVHSGIGLHEKSIAFYRQGLTISTEYKDTFNVANITARMGGEFNYLSMYDTALVYNLEGLRLFKLIKHKRGTGATMVNLATTYNELRQYDKSIQISLEAIVIREELGDTYAVTMLKSNLAECYFDKKEYLKALVMALECEKLVKEQNEPELIFQNYSILSRIYQALNNPGLALNYARKIISLKDSIFEKTNLKAINELQTKYDTEKKEKEISALQFEKKSSEEKALSERKTRNLIIASITLIAIIIAFFTLLLYKRFKISNKQKLIIEKQKEIVDEKQKEVIDSINYALTIQQSIIPSEKDLMNGVADAMVFFKPKDIVSGDFYWHTSLNNYIFYVVADCTGHGVPGAFMSLMGINYLSEIINEKKETDTAVILNLLRDKVITSLNKSSTTTQKRDGMDMVIIRLDTATQQIQFSGANNAIYVLANDELKEFKGNKMPIGLHSGELFNFESKTIQLAKNNRIFAFTDGLPDQFGGAKGKKLMYKKVESLIIDNKHKSLLELKHIVSNMFNEWKGNNEQVDDITLMGIEL